MDENYYEMLIKNISNVEIEESDRESFFDSFAAIKKEAETPKILNVIVKTTSNPKFIKDMLGIMGLSSSNVDKIIEFLKKSDYISSNEEVLDWLINLDSEVFHNIIYYFKPLTLGNSEGFNKKYFPIYNFPIIRIMDYCLKHNHFEKFSVCTERLEFWTLNAYWNARESLIEESINNNRGNPEFFFIFSYKNPSIVKKYITINDIPNLTYLTCKMFISQDILPKEFVNSNAFFDVFKSFTLDQQIEITELLEGHDYDKELIDNLHKLFNKEKVESKNISIITNNILEVSPKYLKRLRDEIKESSYFKKNNLEQDDFWLFINELLGESEDLKYLGSLTKYSYYRLRNLYEECYRYATESIVSSLYPLANLNEFITYMDQDKFNILYRVQTFSDLSNLGESFKEREFCGFSILTQDNFSHYPGSIVHGYYSKVTPDLIAHIYPADSLSTSWAKYQKDLSKKINMLLDIDDLNALTYAYKTYNQLCIRTKTKEHEILKQDAIICLGDVDDKSIKYAEEHNKNILVLRKNKNTIEYNDDIYSHLQ